MTSGGRIGVAGNGPLAKKITVELQRAGADVAKVEGDLVGQAASLSCVVLAADDDEENVDLALQLREEHPSLGVVARVFDPVLEEYLTRTSPEIAILSMSQVAVPSLVERLGGTVSSRTSLAAWLAQFARGPEPLLVGALAAVLALALLGTFFFASTMGLSHVDAFYFVITTITTTGYGDISPKDAPPTVKMAAEALMVGGAVALALLFAVLSDWVLSRRLDVREGRVPTRWQSHVVLVGAGHISERLARVLHDKGEAALVIERDANHPALPLLRSQGHHVLVGDATRDATLRLAAVERARAVLVLTDQDSRNLHIALLVRELSRRSVVWTRIDSPRLAAHVKANASVDAGSPLSMAASAFAAEAHKRARQELEAAPKS